MIRLWICYLQLAELFMSSVVHLLYGFYIFSSAVAGDLSQSLNELFFKPNVNIELKEELPNERASNVDNLPPIVMVHGIFGFGKGRLGGLSYFAGAEKKDERVLVPDLGSLTSIYDRARELFYYLKGGQVDYGEEHSKACGHSQFGRVYEQGHYPEWDEDHPIHFVGHSAGAQVVRVLQQMLADKAFKGFENTNENWVLSITSLSGAFNGTTRTYLDGMQPEDGRSMKPICLLQLCRLGVIIYDWFDIPWLKAYYNFGFDHFNMSWKKAGIWGLVDCLLGNAGPFASGDWILPDLTIQGSMLLNSHLNTFPNTYYFSYATKRTRKIFGVTVPSGILGIHPMLFIRVLQMSQWRHPPDVSPPYKGYRDEDWQDNDGALNTISMTHPRLPIEHPNRFVANESDCHPMEPGIWGDPTVYESFWRKMGEKCTMVIKGSELMSYISDLKKPCWFLEPELEEAVKRLHRVTGNAVVDDRHVVVGSGSTQLFQAVLYAITTTTSSFDGATPDQLPVPVVCAAPYYSQYEEETDYLRSGLYKWAGDAYAFEKGGPYIEVVTSPNNPDGTTREAVVINSPSNHHDQGKVMYDLAYYWPQYTPITRAADYDIMYFTFSKSTGHAGSRIGWALIKDEEIARKMTKFIELSSIGVSKDSQLRAAKIMGAICDGYVDFKSQNYSENFFEYAHQLMGDRWKRLREVVSRSNVFSLPKYPQEYCIFHEEYTESYPAFAWLKCKDTDQDCEELLRQYKIVGRGGTRFGSDSSYARLSMLSREDEFQQFLERLQSIKGVASNGH